MYVNLTTARRGVVFVWLLFAIFIFAIHRTGTSFVEFYARENTVANFTDLRAYPCRLLIHGTAAIVSKWCDCSFIFYFTSFLLSLF